ncbi:MAG: BMP family lipoprotein [Actinomycetes bacterium]
MRSVMKVAALTMAGALALAACGSSSGGAGSSATKETVKVGMAYDVGGRGDKSFNDAAAAGLEAVKSQLNVETKELSATQGENDAAKADRLTALADAGYSPIIAVGFAYAPALKTVAPKYPNVKFALIDSTDTTGPNISNLTFAEEQGSYLVGVAAALKSKTHHIGYIGGVNVPLLQKFQAGYEAGAKATDPTIKIDSKYISQPPDFSGFGAPDKGKTIADGMYDGGADVIYAAAGGSGIGVFQSAKAKGTLAIGVDSDQYKTAPADLQSVILTSMIKRVDVAVQVFVKQVADNAFKAGQQVFDLGVNGVGYSTSGGFVDDIKDKLEAAKADIVSGKITVPTKPTS